MHVDTHTWLSDGRGERLLIAVSESDSPSVSIKSLNWRSTDYDFFADTNTDYWWTQKKVDAD